MEKRPFCYDFIELNECSRKSECLYAHVLIPDNEKEQFLKLNPRNLNQTNTLKDIMMKSSTTTIGSGGNISKCKNCGKGIIYKKQDAQNNSVRSILCNSCIKLS
jgi:hypothetical protein